MQGNIRYHSVGDIPVAKPVVLIADKLAPSTVEALGDQVEVRWVDGPNLSLIHI